MSGIIKQTHNYQSYAVEEDGKVYIGERADLTGSIDRVQRMRQAEINSGVMGHCVASIPFAAIAQWAGQFDLGIDAVLNDDALLDRCINDYGKFKVKGGWQ